MDKRIKSGLAVTPWHIKVCDENLRYAKADSRNSFVEKAIEYYAAYLNARQKPLFFEEMFTSGAKRKMEQVGKALGTGQYKIAVELDILANLLASQMQVSAAQMKELRRNSEERVKALGSVPTFEQAYDYQHDEGH